MTLEITISNISLSESFLDSSTLTENNNLKINGYKMVRAHHSCKLKKGGVGVCAYVRKSLPYSYLSDCLTLEVTISNEKGYVIIYFI